MREMGNLSLCTGRLKRERVSPQYAMEMSGNEYGGGGRVRQTASRRLLSGEHSPTVSLIGGGIGPNNSAHWPPSRRREEARALQNLQRRVEACRSMKAATKTETSPAPSSSVKPPALDNRPHFLQKVHNHLQFKIVFLICYSFYCF